MEDMIRKLILILLILVALEHIIKEKISESTKIKKYEYKGKYKDPKHERIVERIGE
jgi:hypothetical protein